ncbi:homologous-pairing protein 2 homolog [Daktulosphaira vitifoliae]|uniref:homologous-pairing protein 2 homolog n=1 Tax=Daktulosphaira vitifoliae TaxID=58002 RepID=UPI0021AA8307|nr:homologous-pairing protein 2 homolog [Daktulosphaira vitifoliae]XP_050541389.1 homologous-pairing protein 2 homolog [Daktulosphaira vitifoliae]
MEKDKVYKFMVTGNRPYSANDVFSNLQKHNVGKAAVDKALDQLVKDNKIFVKIYGKQKVFCVIQPDTTLDNQKEIERLDEELLKTNEKLKDVEQKLKKSEVEVKMLKNTYSIKEAENMITELNKSITELKSKLDEVSKNKVCMSEKDKEKIKFNHEKVIKEYRKRKRICMDVLDSILENCPKTKKALFEEIGIETDESVKMPSL